MKEYVQVNVLNFWIHVISLATGSFAAMTISEASAASMAVMLRPMRSPHEGGSQNELNPMILRTTYVNGVGKEESVWISEQWR